MFNTKRWAFVTLSTILLTACNPKPDLVPVEVTRIVTETVVTETVVVEITRVVAEIDIEEIMVEPEPDDFKNLVICQAQTPDTLYPYSKNSEAALTIQHAIFENNFTNVSFAYQAQGIEKIPSLADDDAVINHVEVNIGDTIIDANDMLVILEEGTTLINSDGEVVIFNGSPVMMNQLIVDFTMKTRTWSDGVPVTAADSLFSFKLAADPDTPISKYVVERTVSYQAIDNLSTRWIGVPGFFDSTYFTNFWAPYPEHIWGSFTAAELLTAEESNQLPIGDGPFAIQEWIDGESIHMTPNEFYYQEGLPYLDSITFKFIPDTNKLIAELVSNDCDIILTDGLDADQAPFLLEAEESGLLTAYFEPGTSWEHIDFGINSEPGYAATRPDWFEDVRVRQAMTLCTDRQSMVDNILFGRSEVIHSYIPSIHPLYAEGLSEWPYDVDAANTLLDEAGYSDSDGDGIREDPVTGTPFAPTLGTTTGSDVRQQLTQMFKENQLECGIDVHIYALPADEWYADGPDGLLFGTHFDLGEFAWRTGVEPPCELYLSEQTPTAENGWTGQNETGFINEAYDAACLKAINNLPGTDAYLNGHLEAQIIFSEQVPIIPLFLRLKVAAASPNVVNFGVDATESSELYNIFEIDIQQ
ncbi:MAG: peptide ABC transporter substrate-binding protein [Chloroflexi bacterium]|nr:peptide ABC transporter substrate-binding protein [Chloroflexota bacterium]